MKATLVLASQRSGSTLLCRDIENLGGMGNPREHLLPILGKNKSDTYTEADVLKCMEKGRTSDDTVAVKIMVNYAPVVYAYITGKPEVNRIQSMQGIIDWAHRRFDHVLTVVLVRESVLEQAISRAMANLTGVWHRTEEDLKTKKPGGGKDVGEHAINLAVLRALPKVIDEKMVLRDIAHNNPDRVLRLRYEDLRDAMDKTSAALCRYARKQGFEPHHKTPERQLVKLIDAKRTAEIKRSFTAFIENLAAE